MSMFRRKTNKFVLAAVINLLIPVYFWLLILRIREVQNGSWIGQKDVVHIRNLIILNYCVKVSLTTDNMLLLLFIFSFYFQDIKSWIMENIHSDKDIIIVFTCNQMRRRSPC